MKPKKRKARMPKMGNNLLDALKSAGLADEKKARKAENAKKQQQHRDLKSGAARNNAASTEVAAAPERTQAVQNVEIQVKDRLAQIYQNAALTDISGRKKFYFQTPDNYIDCIMLSDVAAALLDRGKYALVANESLDDYIMVRRATALAIEAIDKKRIIILKRQEV